MKNFIIILSILLTSSLALSAQNMWSLQYSIGLPHGETQDYTNNSSFRGLSIETKSFATSRLAFGAFISWNTFTDYIKEGHIGNGSLDVYGKEYRYINTMPLMATASFYPLQGQGNELNPYVSMGVGTIFQEQLSDLGTNSYYNDGWMFGLAPEVGLKYTLPGGFDLNLNYRFIYGFETSEVSALSYSNINIGMGVTF